MSNMALTAEALHRYGVRMSPQEMEDLLLRTLDEVMRTAPLPDPRKELTESEIEALESSGFDLTPVERDGADDPVTRTAVLYAAIKAKSLSVSDVAALLKVNESRVRQLLGAHALYGFKDGHTWRIPRFQFAGDAPIPGLEQVMRRLPADIHPIEVYMWFTSPDPNLESDHGEQELSPRDWLLSGRSPQPVADLAASLDVGI